MQARQTKIDRKKTAAARAAARSVNRLTRRLTTRMRRSVDKVIAQEVEAGRKAYASPGHIAAVTAAHVLTCSNWRAEKIANRATIPAEAASNETR
jgi:hypothetical protein